MVQCDNELTFENQTFTQKTSLPCASNCPEAIATVPIASGNTIVADSINKKVFNVLKQIIFFGERPYTATNYQDLLSSFIGSYEKLHADFPEDTFGWSAKVEGRVTYHSASILNIEIKHYTYTGGAHGYQGVRSLLFDSNTGKTILIKNIFKDLEAFKAFAEKRFRTKYNIPMDQPINATGLMFENDIFHLPQNIFYTDKGLLLFYNSYEVASYADGTKELLFSYKEVAPYLALE
jgi:hypothetical protein